MPDRIPVSVVVMTKNEERNIAACLDSLAACAEVFVVDSGSEDATRSIAAMRGARVISFEWNGKYPKKKQWCLEHLQFACDWVLYLDADERLTPELVVELAALFAAGTPSDAGYFIAFDYVFLGRLLKHGHRVVKLALFDRRRGRFLDYPDHEAVHAGEVEPHFQPHIDGATGRLRQRIVHDDHDSLFGWFERHNRYSDWEAVLLARGALWNPAEAQPRMRRRLKAAFSRLPFRGTAWFLYFYFGRLGFLDGRAGLHYAIAKSFYYWQVGAKLRELRGTERELRGQPRKVAA